VYRFDHFGWSLRVLGLGATHGSEIVHIQHSYASFIGRKLHPLGRRLQPPVGRRMQRAWLDFAAQGWDSDERSREDHGPGEIHWSNGHDWPVYDTENRYTRIIMTARDTVVSDPDGERRKVWADLP
jgi:para-nitrobenzyl esterase